MLPVRWLAIAMLVIAIACSSSTKAPDHKPRPVSGLQTGYATWYGGGHHGGPTASGERYDKRALTAAHRSLRMGTRVRVTNKRNGKSVILRINDRGPYGNASRIIDVSEKAAELLDMVEAGVVPVSVEIVR
jgi:rare lipoprotein A